MAKALLLISSRPEDAEFATEVAIGAGLSLLTAKTPAQGAGIILAETPAAIVVDASSEAQYKEFEKAIQEKVGLFSDKINANGVHFLSSEPLENVPYLIRSPVFGHFVIRNFSVPKAAGQHYARIIKATLSDRAFGLGNMLKPDTKVQVVKLHATSNKQDAVEAVRNYLISAKFQSRMASVVANSVDELLMNAMFDAPVDEIGRPTLSATPRSENIQLSGKSEVELHVGYDGTYVGICAIDHFGSLDKAKLLDHISRIYTEEEYKVKTSVAGAGIGLATVFRSGGSFFFASENRVRTEVAVFFRRTDSFREFKDQFRFISTQFYL